MSKNKTPSVYAKSWAKLKKDKAAMLGLFVISFAVLISILGGNIRPDSSPFANDSISSIGKLRTNSTIKVLKVKRNKNITTEGFFGKLFFGGQEPIYNLIPITSYRFEGDKITLTLYSSFKNSKNTEPENQSYDLVDVCYSIDKSKEFDPIINNGQVTFKTLDQNSHTIPIEELQEEVKSNNLKTKIFWLGTDVQGRDLLSRTMAGTVVSLSVGLIAVLISLIIGVTLGAIAGYYRGWVDDLVMWFINVVWSIPTLLLIIAVTLLLGKGFYTVFLAVGLTMWVELARVVRGQILSIREKEYIEAGKALGFSNYRIITKHIFPNIIGSIIVICASNFAAAILIEAGLSFLGIGSQIPMVSWGTMIEQHRSFITHSDKAFLALIPGLSIIFLVFSFMLLGNGLRDSFDVHEE